MLFESKLNEMKLKSDEEKFLVFICFRFQISGFGFEVIVEDITKWEFYEETNLLYSVGISCW